MREALLHAITRDGQSGHAQRVVIWVVYQRPRDMPHTEFAVRGHITSPTGPIKTTEAFSFDTLADARKAMQHAGLHRMGRDPRDDVAIVETWI